MHKIISVPFVKGMARKYIEIWERRKYIINTPTFKSPGCYRKKEIMFKIFVKNDFGGILHIKFSDS